MTTFFTIVAAIHVLGLYALLFAMRRAPVAVERSKGFHVIAHAEESEAIAAVRAHTI